MELQFDVFEENKEQKDIPSAPVEPNIEIRTMKSDIKALKESGGDLTNIPAIVSRPTVSDKAIFAGSSAGGGDNSPSIKTVVIIIIVIILAAVVGFASYYASSQFFK